MNHRTDIPVDCRPRNRPWLVAVLTSLLLAGLAWAAGTVPTDIQQPGTQPGEVTAFATNCDTCHAGTPNPDVEPSFGWHGGMMSHSARDSLFWATVAVAEQDFLPGADPATRGGVGDLCLRCHTPNGWLGGRSTPTDGSAMTGEDERGVECEFCHLLVNPDAALTIAGTTEEQTAPFEAFDAVTGAGYHGSGEYVINSGGTRLGPYSDATANHAFLQSGYHRQGEMCGTCHDVSNPAVGDLAHNFGAMVDLAAGTYSGVPGAVVDDKAAFNNPPYAYGIVERTFSEWKASALDDFRVNDFATLPTELQDPNGSLKIAYDRAYDATRGDADYVDDTPRYYTCQTCHMAAAAGKGCNKNNAPVRDDLPRHDQTGGGYWMPDVVKYQADHGTLRLGTLTQLQRDALTAGANRARAHLSSAATVGAVQNGSAVDVTVTNLTGHKLISGYPEGRRMWLNLKWYDSGPTLIHEDGGYGPIGRTVNDIGGTPHAVESILDLSNTVIYQAKPGMDKEWADQLLALGYPASLVLEYDRLTDAPEETLGELSAESAGHVEPTFHFVLNNKLVSDNRIPPYGFSRDEALARSALPVPADQFGNPGTGGVYDHFDLRSFPIPANAASVEVTLYYQQTSWEYIQFLFLANDGLSPFLGEEGDNLLDAWLNTGMSPPHAMATTTIAVTAAGGAPGEASKQTEPLELLEAGWDSIGSLVQLDYTPGCDSVEHAVYYGDLSLVSSYAYSGAACNIGSSGTATFDPGPGSFFFLVVASNGASEGSYGKDSMGNERPEDVGTSGCDLPQDLNATCN